ncbi:MAG: hypothetical protein R3C14_48015 [Caldilineaceae bacterium]
MSEQDQRAERRAARARVDAESLARAHEVHDVKLRPILLFGLGLLIVIIIALVVLRWQLLVWTGQPLIPAPQIPPAVVTPLAVGAGVQPAPAIELRQVLTEQQQRLNSYGWVDQGAGTVHLPIERAMELLLAEGVSARDEDPPNFGLPPAYSLDGTGGQGAQTP